MFKRISAVLMCASLINIPIAASAEGECDISAIDGIDVTVKKIEYNRGLQSEFNIKNSSDSDMEVAVSVTVEDETGNMLSSADTVRKISHGKSVPLKFNSSVIEENTSLKISVVNPPKDNEIYVAENGSDEAEGTFKKPLKTLGAAIEQAKTKTGDAVIVMRGGEYDIKNTIDISGFDNLSSLVIKSDGTEVVFSGGVSVKGADFKKVTDTGILSMFPENVAGKLYSINLSDYGIKKDTENPKNTALYYDGKTEQIAQYPNEGYSETAAVTWLDYDNKILALDSEEIKDWKNYNEAWVSGFFFWDWDFSNNKISSISNGRITISPYNAGSYSETVGTNKPWSVYNMPSELDIEGEYIIKGNVLYYYPNEADVASGKFDNTHIMINTDKTDMINISEGGNVAIENITFENSRGYFINAKADNVKLLGCKFKDNAANAVYVEGYNNLVSGCDFYNLGGRGLYMTGGDRNTLTSSQSMVKNCYFERTGQFRRTNTAALTIAGCGTVAANNTITQTPHLALSYVGNNLIIENNDIYNCLTDNSGDAGIIYTGNNLSNLGNVIRKNYIHDSNSGLGAIYWDDFLSGQTAEHNVFENITTSGLFIHGGVCNSFNQNIVKGAKYGARARGKGLNVTLTNGTTYNAWEEINGRYSIYSNVFMALLEGSSRDPKNYPGFPWKDTTWQTSYQNVLKYVNTRTDPDPLETSLCGNTFIDVSVEGCNIFGVKNLSNVTSTGNVTEFTDATQAEYENIKSTSGIYADKYRKMP